MPQTFVVHKATFVKDRGWWGLARVQNPDGDNITQSTVTQIDVEVTRYNNGTATSTYSTTLTIADVVFNALQTDTRWIEDPTGYNFAVELPATAFPELDHYTVDVKFTPDSGQVYSVQWQGYAKSSQA